MAQFRYSIHYLFSLSFYAFILGFFPLYCGHLGFTPREVAAVSIASTLGSIIGSPLMIELSYRWIPPRQLMFAASILSLLFFCIMMSTTNFFVIFVLWFLATLIKRGAESLVDAQAIRDAALGKIRFELVRTWGSVGFVIATLLFGLLVDTRGNEFILYGGLVILVTVVFSSYAVRTTLHHTPLKQRDSFAVGRATYRRNMVLLLLVTALVFGSHAALYIYLSLYLEALGWSGSGISAAWTVGVVSEIIMFVLFRTLEIRISLLTILKLSIIGTILRWLLLYSTEAPALILASQILHAASFASCYMATMKLTHMLLPEHLRDRGQAVLAAAGMGIGSLGGRILIGGAADQLGSYREVNELFLPCAVAAAVGLLLSFAIRPATATSNELRHSNH